MPLAPPAAATSNRIQLRFFRTPVSARHIAGTCSNPLTAYYPACWRCLIIKMSHKNVSIIHRFCVLTSKVTIKSRCDCILRINDCLANGDQRPSWKFKCCFYGRICSGHHSSKLLGHIGQKMHFIKAEGRCAVETSQSGKRGRCFYANSLSIDSRFSRNILDDKE